MPTKIPTVSSIGWVDSIEKKGDYALTCFFTSEYSQSTLYYGSVSSLPYIVKTYGHDPVELHRHASATLDRLLGNYFSNIEVRVRVNEIDPESPGKLIIQFSCIIQEDGQTYHLGRQVEFLDGTLKKIVKLNNG